MKKSKMLTYSTCALLSAGLICGGIVYNNTTAESTKVAAIGLTNIDSGTKDIMKQVQEVTTKEKMLRKLHQKQKQVKKKQKSSQDTSSTDSLDDSFYPIVNLGTNLVRETFYQDFSSSEDFQTIGRELQALSTDYFSTSDYYMSEGLQLVQNDKNQLLKKEKYSLQPLNGELVDGQEINKMVENISEQDYYEKSGDKYTLKGMSIAIILDPKGGTNATLSEGSIDSYAKETISRLYKYLQNKKSVKDIPNFYCCLSSK